MQKKTYIPEIHDISGACPRAFEAMLELLPPKARPKAACLVTPTWEGRYDLRMAPSMIRALNQHPGLKVLHGHKHWRNQTFLNHLIYGTNNHGEFTGLDLSTARRKISLAVNIFTESMGFAPHWFCAPRWKMPSRTARVLPALGLAHIMELKGYRAIGGNLVRVPPLSFNTGERTFILKAEEIRRKLLTTHIKNTGRPFRLVLHPRDLDRPAILKEIKKLTQWLDAHGWQPISPGEIL